MARAKIGDIIEISTKEGFAYAQYTHNHNEAPKYGQLLRVLEGVYAEHQNNLEILLHNPVQFVTFFPLNAALTRGIVSVIGNMPIPTKWQEFPMFRVKGLIDKETKKAKRWGLWNGVHKETMLDRPLTEAEKKLPILAIINDAMLIEYIEMGWRPELDIHT